MKFTLNRTRTLASLVGVAIEFVKDVPTHVPPEMYAEVMAAGATPVEEITDAPEVVPSREPADTAARKAEIFTAFEMLALRNERGDFTAGGAPRDNVLESILGWKLSGKERDMLWTEFKVGAEK